MPVSSSQGMTDEQVEELLQALLDFRELLVGLNDRFQHRMALLEQEFAEQRTLPQAPEKRLQSATGPLPRPGTGSLARMGTGTLTRPTARPEVPAPRAPEPEPMPEPEEETFEPDEMEGFSIVDIDDDDDDF